MGKYEISTEVVNELQALLQDYLTRQNPGTPDEPVPEHPTPTEPEPTPETPAEDAGWKMSAAVDGNKIVGHFTPPEGFTGGFIANLELQDQAGNKLAQHFSDHSKLAVGSLTLFLAPSASFAPGTYYVHQGVFGENWTPQYAWASATLTVTLPLDSGSTPGPVTEPGPDEEPSTPVEPAPLPDESVPSTTTPSDLYVDKASVNAVNAKRLRDGGRTADADLVQKIADVPAAVWYNGGDTSQLKAKAAEAKAKDQWFVAVLYDVPGRDMGGHSAGGAATVAKYLKDVDAFCEALGDTKTIIPIEPDALNQPDSLDKTRLDCLRGACERIAKLPNAKGYLDAGHSAWRWYTDVAARVKQVNPPKNIGIVVNVSSFQPTKDSAEYGLKVAKEAGVNGVLIDTSRNGGDTPEYNYCNPDGHWAGPKPTTNTGIEGVDAFVWVKPPGESDGNCNGGPNAGEWFESWAIAFAKKSFAKGAL